jgi:multiple antibiotic resistance protein
MVLLESLFFFKTEVFISTFVTLLALINPFQKIFVINSLQSQMTERELRYVSIKSSITALVILLLFLAMGNVIFTFIFKIQIYSFRVTCGMVLVYSGWNALQKGVLINIGKDERIQDIASVPIAIPMIAGPGTVLAVIAAIGVNLIIMLSANKIGKFLIKLNLMSPIVRIIGLIIATIGIQMIFDGGVGFLTLHGFIK